MYRVKRANGITTLVISINCISNGNTGVHWFEVRDFVDIVVIVVIVDIVVIVVIVDIIDIVDIVVIVDIVDIVVIVDIVCNMSSISFEFKYKLKKDCI
jgi:hypothetical protein